ncbi:MAG: hypothetical protein LC725_05085, partial [Lentisphaerae bacterium]|nr:hypothetical protein [Lentisphaerota bacterium]
MPKNSAQPKPDIVGRVDFPMQWTVFGPFDGVDLPLTADILETLPGTISIGGQAQEARQVTPTRNQYKLTPLYGEPPYQKPRSTLIYVLLHSEAEQEATLGFGADFFYRVYVNGAVALDLMEEGNGGSRPAINNHCVKVWLHQGDNLVVVHLVNGKGAPLLALGGPEELRKGDFTSILPPPDSALDGKQLLEKYPAAPDAPLRWVIPDGFDPREPGLGIREMQEAEHVELMHALRSKASADEGGSGAYESVCHGSWNHNTGVFVYKDRLLATWHNHALDENGPGSRTLARVGKVLNDRGDVDWGADDSVIELAPAAVPVRRRLLVSDSDAVRDAQAKGGFRIVDDRLIFCGGLQALHGVTSRMPRNIPAGEVLAPEAYAHARTPKMANGSFAVWDLDFPFYQEWGIKDDRFQPLSPLYKVHELADSLQMTTDLRLPLEPLVSPYSDAPLLSEAPADFQELVRKAKEQGGAIRFPGYQPGTSHLTQDGTNGLTHGTSFKRPDGSMVAVRENQKPTVHPFYYASEKPDAESFYPPAVRTNLYGAADPAAGSLPDGTVYILGNSPNRANMYITVSKDGRVFDRSWLLLYRRLSDYTPGAMKTQGGPGAGPQYFRPVVIGQ